MRIELEQCLLRPWEPTDADNLARYANNPRVAAQLRDGFPHPYTRAHAREWIRTAAEKSDALMLAVEVDGGAVGGIGLVPFSDVYRRTAELGYWLAEPYWGRGIIPAAVRALVETAFSRFDLVRIQAGVYAGNRASMRVLEKAGFVREAIHRNAVWKNNRLLDEYLYVCFTQEDRGGAR